MNRNKLYPWYFASGAAILFFLLCFLPGLLGIAYSFTDWNNFSDEINFVGLTNYKKIFQGNSEYLKYIGNTVLFTVVTTVMKTVVGLALALLLTQKFIKCKNFQRMIIFSPQVMSYLVVGLVFRSMLHPTTGFLNNFLRGIGLDGLAKNWLTDLSLVFPTVMTVGTDIDVLAPSVLLASIGNIVTWEFTGYNMLIFYSSLSTIPHSLYEAASIDGANFFQKLRNITLPLLKPVLVNVTVLNVTYGLRVFDMIYSLTNGGPGNATGVINTAVYKEFSKGDLAMGTTLSSVLFFFVLALLYFIIKSMENKEVEA